MVLRTLTSVLVSFSSRVFSFAGKDGHKHSGHKRFLWPVILAKRELLFSESSRKKSLGRILNSAVCVVVPSLDQSMWTKE